MWERNAVVCTTDFKSHQVYLFSFKLHLVYLWSRNMWSCKAERLCACKHLAAKESCYSAHLSFTALTQLIGGMYVRNPRPVTEGWRFEGHFEERHPPQTTLMQQQAGGCWWRTGMEPPMGTEMKARCLEDVCVCVCVRVGWLPQSSHITKCVFLCTFYHTYPRTVEIPLNKNN